MMACVEHVDCHECQLNMEIIELTCDLISKQIFQGMEKCNARVAVHVNRRGHLSDHHVYQVIGRSRGLIN